MKPLSKVTGCSLNIGKSVAVWTNTEHSEKGTRKVILFTVALRRKCFGINLTKEVKGTCNENFKSLEKEIQKDIGGHSWVGIVTIGKWMYY